MNRSRETPGLPVHHQLPEFTQTHVHRVGDAIQPSHPLLSPSPPAPNPSQHQGFFQWVSSSHDVAKVLEFQFTWQQTLPAAQAARFTKTILRIQEISCLLPNECLKSWEEILVWAIQIIFSQETMF